MNGILMKLEMNLAILEGRKTVTRRLDHLKEINQEPDKWKCLGAPYGIYEFDNLDTGERITVKPRYHIGQVVFIREAWCSIFRYDEMSPFELPDDAPIFYMQLLCQGNMNLEIPYGRVRSPLHLPARFARTFLQIVDVRAERLQEITPEDALAEGVNSAIEPDDIDFAQQSLYEMDLLDKYKRLWDSINPDYPFKDNPWCFRYEFKKVGRPQ